VGTFTDANDIHHAYRWTQSKGTQDLGTMFDGSKRSLLHPVNLSQLRN